MYEHGFQRLLRGLLCVKTKMLVEQRSCLTHTGKSQIAAGMPKPILG